MRAASFQTPKFFIITTTLSEPSHQVSVILEIPKQCGHEKERIKIKRTLHILISLYSVP